MRQLFRHPSSRGGLIALTAAWITLTVNAPTIAAFYNAADAGQGIVRWIFALGGVLFAFALTLLLVWLLSLPFRGRWLRAPLIIMLMASAITGYYCWALGMRFDRTMFANTIQTNLAEVRDLISLPFLGYVVLFGVFPSIWLARFVSVSRLGNWRGLLKRSGVFVALLLGALGAIVYPLYPRYASTVRSQVVTHERLVPTNLVVGTVGYYYFAHNASIVRTPVGTDARLGSPLAKPRLVVLVVGETARAANFGMNGYARATDARMRDAGAIYFPDTVACGTSTAFSVPCIFSGLDDADYTLGAARRRETLIDVVVRAGVRTLWLENDGGCKEVCDRAEQIEFNNAQHRTLCPELGNCFDEIMLEGLAQRITAAKRDTLLVLHLKGSHGPAYYKRYPAAHEKYKPACQSNALASCDPQALVNAYDNTIAYTDFILDEVRKQLIALSPDFVSALFYVSDHGESLGENGLYLHGLPRAVAPQVQINVPMLVWLSDEYFQLNALSRPCAIAQQTIKGRHENVYPTILGLLAVQTSVYRQDRDIFAKCRGAV